MNFSLSVNLDNAAFEADPSAELERILVDLTARVASGALASPSQISLLDANGNTVGTARVQ